MNAIRYTSTIGHILSPAKDKDVGYDLPSVNIRVVGKIYNHCGRSVENFNQTFTIEDFRNISGKEFLKIDFIEYDTGIALAPSDLFHVELFPNSRVSKLNLVMANSIGLIDPGYRNTIRARFKYVIQPENLLIRKIPDMDYFYTKIDLSSIYAPGDTVAQLVIRRTEHLPCLIQKTPLGETERGLGGFGSTSTL